MRYNHCSDGLINTLVCFSVNWMGKRREGRGLLKIWVNALNAMEDGLHLMQKRRGVKLGEERLQNEIERGQAVAGRREGRKCNQGGYTEHGMIRRTD